MRTHEFISRRPSSIRRVRIHILCLLLFIAGESHPASGQSEGGHTPLAEAIRVRDAGDYDAALRLLQPYTTAHPDDVQAILVLAQTHYWAGNPEAARAVYEQALIRQPDHPTLRLEYARLLVELFEPGPARTLLEPLRREPPTASEAELLLGTLAYWQGRLRTAKQHFQEALRWNRDNVRASQYLHEIRLLTVPWLDTKVLYRWDNQPVHEAALSTEAGFYLSPLRTLAFHIKPTHFTANGSEKTATALELALTQRWPRLRLEGEARAGRFDRLYAFSAEWIWCVGAHVRLPGHLVLRGTAERGPYVQTQASLLTPVTTRTAQALLDWVPPSGWISQISFEHVQYPDQNTAYAAYAWVLAPLLRARLLTMSLGYSYATSDARESRFMLATALGATPGDFLAEGYWPYYTPEGLVSHSVLALLTLQPSDTITLSVDGAYGFYATEQAPFFPTRLDATADPRSLPRAFYTRRYYPWRVRGKLSIALGPKLSLTGTAEHQRTAFYATTEMHMNISYRFTAFGQSPK